MEGGHYSNFDKITNYTKFEKEVSNLVKEWRATKQLNGAAQFIDPELSVLILKRDELNDLDGLKNKLLEAEECIKSAKAVL